MANILLDYVFPITVITPTQQASTAFLKQVCVVAKPKSGQEANVGTTYECATMAEVAARTDNANIVQLFNGGKNKVSVLLSNHLDIAAYLVPVRGKFFTLLASDDFADADIEEAQADGVATITNFANLVSGTDDALAVAGVSFVAQAGAATLGDATYQAATSNDATAASLAAQINAHPTANLLVEATVEGAVVTIKAKNTGALGNDIAVAYTDNDTNVGLTLSGLSAGKLAGGSGFNVGAFRGITGIMTLDEDFAAEQAAITNRAGFFADTTSKAKNMLYAFGKFLSNVVDWSNQQYIDMPADDKVTTLGAAESFFEEKVSFVITDDEFSKKLALFTAGGRPISAPYILENLQIDLQSKALQWISGNQPTYSLRNAALLESRLQQDVIDLYITRGWIEDGIVEITLEQDNFVATGRINVAQPTALWRVASEMRQTL